MLSVLAAFGAVLLAAVALSNYVTPYRVVLAPRSFALALTLLCAPRLATLWSTLGDRWSCEAATTRRMQILSAGLLGAAFFASAMLQTLAGYRGNYSGFLHLTKEVAAHAPFLQERPDLARSLIVSDAGYDGQFVYLMAFDPFLQRFKDQPEQYRAFVDLPPYRYGRIGFSLLTALLSAGRPERYPSTMMWLIIAAHGALAMLLGAYSARHGASPFAALWYLAIPGFISSMKFALPEALAAAGIVAGLICWETRRTALAALCFGASLLVRETGVVFVLAIVLMAASRPANCLRRGDGDPPTLDPTAVQRWMVLASLTPLITWRLFVASRLFPDFGWAALVASPGDLGVPFAGLLRSSAAAGWGAGPAAALVYPVLVTLALAVAAVLLTMRRGAFELAAVTYGAVAASLTYEKIWVHLPSGERGTFELFLCLLLLLLAGRDRPVWIRRALTGLFAVLLAYTFLLAPDAYTSRAALLLVR